MPGKIYEVIAGGRVGQIAFVDNKQEEPVTRLKKVHAYYFNGDNTPRLSDGRHENGLVGIDKLKHKAIMINWALNKYPASGILRLNNNCYL